ncbi:MAG: dihydrofolate reductase [Bacteroidales bacterium]|nr:dihydrofolate reductase [Bacteroidales bacterium]
MVSIIVATARDGAIGVKGDLPFHLSPDLRHFKQVTLGKPVIMGRKTFESLPGGPLPGRRNIIVTRNTGYSRAGADIAGSLDEALGMVADQAEVMIIGGGEIYRQAMPLTDRVYLTEIDAEASDADTFFPDIPQDFGAVDTGEWLTDERTGLRYRFITYDRR